MKAASSIFRNILTACPVCGNDMNMGFCSRSSPLSFVALDKLARLVFKDEDLHRAGLKMILPWKAQYSPSYLCSTCNIYIVDHGRVISSVSAKSAAVEMDNESAID